MVKADKAGNLQFLTSPSGDEMVVMSRAVYDKLMAAVENAIDDRQDVRDAKAISDRISSGEEATFPHEVVMRMRKENRIKALRKYRGMTQKELAEKADLNALYISQIETGKAAGGRKGLEKIAAALGVNLAVILSA
jgi:ribosome-binding protein aMBF1 (putative translation factor)